MQRRWHGDHCLDHCRPWMAPHHTLAMNSAVSGIISKPHGSLSVVRTHSPRFALTYSCSATSQVSEVLGGRLLCFSVLYHLAQKAILT